jgi:Recombination endonuclease VII
MARVADSLWPDGWRWCAGCQSLVPTFYTSGSRCRACSSEASHGSMIEKTYNLTAEQYAALLELQDHRCAICRARPQSARLAVDHDHRTGKVRGLTCVKCNHELLGAAHDSLDLLQNAVGYLKAPPASGSWQPPAKEARRAVPKAVLETVGTIPRYLSAEDGYRLSGSRGDEVIYILRSALDTPF